MLNSLLIKTIDNVAWCIYNVGMPLIELSKPIELDWDEANKHKSLFKHGITNDETEQVFRDPQKHIINDRLHSDKEERFIILGHNAAGKILIIVFTIRNNRIRVISARSAGKKERKWYEEKIDSSKI